MDGRGNGNLPPRTRNWEADLLGLGQWELIDDTFREDIKFRGGLTHMHYVDRGLISTCTDIRLCRICASIMTGTSKAALCVGTLDVLW